MILDVAAIPFAAVGIFCAQRAFASLGPYRQVLRRATRPVRALEPGPVEVAGAIRAREAPLEALDGTRVAALRTVVAYSHRSGGRTYHRISAIDEIDAVEADLVDESGSAAIDVGSLLLLGERRTFVFTGAAFVERWPALAARLHVQQLVRVTVDQTLIPDGAAGLVSGEAELCEDEIDAGESYRGEPRRRFRLTSTLERPLVLSAFPERVTRRMLVRPAWLLAALAFAWIAIAAALFTAARVLAA